MNKFKKLIKTNKICYTIYSSLLRAILNFWKLFIKVDEKIVLFNCFGGKKFDDSPRVIYNYIISNEKYKNYKLYWAFDDINKYELPKGEKLKNNSIKYFYIALKAKYWITNSSVERGIKFKNKKTIYINTWHGSTIKYIEKDQKDKKFEFNVSKPDILLAQSNYDVGIFSQAFELPKEKIVMSGLPRNDEIAKQITIQEKEKIKQKLNIPIDKKVILYVPTYREFDNEKKENYIKPPIDINKWEKTLKNDYVLLFRIHYETEKILGLSFNNFLVNVSEYETINDLLKIADILISDYSSIIFDYSILERPIFSFAYDYEKYMELRGCYIDITKELPNGICKTEDELLERVINCDYEEEVIKTRRFKQKYIEKCGNSSNYIDSIIK